MHVVAFVSIGRAKNVIHDRLGTQINGARVPAIVFDYPRHSGATNEGMTCGSSIFAYLVFGLGRASTEGTTRPTKIVVWHDPDAELDVQGKDSRRSSWIKFWLGFVQTGSIYTLLG
jgi:hypothetical protein